MDETDDKKAQKKPGAPFFLVAMAFYLLLVHGTSLIGMGAGQIHGPEQLYPDSWSWLNTLLNALGSSARSSALVAIPLLYATMVCTFFLTRTLVPGPVWLGSLAGTFLMAHPLKTEVLFSATGLYFGLATFMALAATLAYARSRHGDGVGRYLLSLALFACAVVPFSVNGALFIVVFLIELLAGDPDKRNWAKLFPYAAIAMLGGWLHMETLYGSLASVGEMWGPLFLIIYPIGLLPETVAELSASPLEAWVWGTVLAVSTCALLFFVKSAPLRLVVLAIVLFRFFPGAMSIDFTTLEGGGQLFYPLALSGVGLSAFCAWLLRFDAWRQPAIALTTILCAVLFVLQFQANRAQLNRLKESEASSVQGARLAVPGSTENGGLPWPV